MKSLSTLALLTSLAMPGVADTIVIGPGDSIQAAVLAAAAGDELIVLPGRYNETINLAGSAEGPASTV